MKEYPPSQTQNLTAQTSAKTKTWPSISTNEKYSFEEWCIPTINLSIRLYQGQEDAKAMSQHIWLRFQHWFPTAAAYLLADISAGPCKQTYSDYVVAAGGATDNHVYVDRCYDQVSCILSHLPQHRLANFASASVVLGLLRGVLAGFGPSVAEISLLSSHRPLLAFLLSIGAPAVYPTRVFEYDNPMEVLQPDPPKIYRLEIRPRGNLSAATISLLEYVFAIGASVNMINTSWELGIKSVLDWSCTTYFVPLIWTFIPLFCHVLGAASISIMRAQERRRQKQEVPGLAQSTRSSASAKKDCTIAARVAGRMKSFPATVRQLLEAEGTICANRSAEAKLPRMPKEAPSHAVLLNVAAGVIGLIHIIFGILIFFSLLFVAVSDVMKQVLTRHLASTVVCKLILIFELAGLRAGLERSTP